MYIYIYIHVCVCMYMYMHMYRNKHVLYVVARVHILTKHGDRALMNSCVHLLAGRLIGTNGCPRKVLQVCVETLALES